jgi:protein-L-isoaspartate(D-aspartate) O-methyltransferase
MTSPTTDLSDALRRAMVEHQIARRGLFDARLLEALREVPREAFVPADLADEAFDDGPLPIGEGQTISQPYIVARMIDAARVGAEDRVLEIGAGSGYAAAVMSRLVAHVDTVELVPSLAERAARTLSSLGYDNVAVHVGDGTHGWSAGAPYDAIVVAAGGRQVPVALLAQLAIGGRLVIPLGPRDEQLLTRIVRTSAMHSTHEVLDRVRFVPFVGAE